MYIWNWCHGNKRWRSVVYLNVTLGASFKAMFSAFLLHAVKHSELWLWPEVLTGVGGCKTKQFGKQTYFYPLLCPSTPTLWCALLSSWYSKPKSVLRDIPNNLPQINTDSEAQICPQDCVISQFALSVLSEHYDVVNFGLNLQKDNFSAKQVCTCPQEHLRYLKLSHSDNKVYRKYLLLSVIGPGQSWHVVEDIDLCWKQKQVRQDC